MREDSLRSQSDHRDHRDHLNNGMFRQTKVFTRPAVRWTVIRQNWMILLAWPVICLIICLGLWGVTTAKLQHDRHAAESNAIQQATGLAHAYAEQIARAAAQLDQITRQVQYDWSRNNGELSLEDQLAKGLYLPSTLLYVTIVGKEGVIVSSTRGRAANRKFSEEAFFRSHKGSKAKGLLISPPAIGIRSGRSLVRFTRRLEKSDGSFDGIVNVAVEPAFLVSFYGESNIGPSDFLAISHLESGLLASVKGSRLSADGTVFKTSPHYADASGIALFPGDAFKDGEARYVAWKALSDYPLVASVGLTSRDMLSGYANTARTYRDITLAGTAFLILFALLGAGLTYRGAYRKHQSNLIRNTYRLATDGAREGFYMAEVIFDAQGKLADMVVKDCNERGAAFLGHAQADLLGRRFSELQWGETGADVLGVCAKAIQSGFYEDEFEVSPDSPLKNATWMQRRLVHAGDALAITLRDISDRKDFEQTLSHMVNADALTKLKNRHWLLNYLPAAVENARRNNMRLALLFVDLDDFKNINDSLGHQAGDRLLQAAALRLQSIIRPQDHVVRLGGDEFTVILEQVDSDESVAIVTGRIIRSLGMPFAIHDQETHPIHASIGISLFPGDANDAEELLKNADIAMYAAKAAGKDSFRFFEPHLSDRLLEKLSLQSALREAIRLQQFIVYYQPRINTFTGKLCGLEALARWNHPQRGIVAPMEFIPAAEETGLILELGELVIRTVFEQLQFWRNAGLTLTPVSINVAPRQFNQGDVYRLLCQCLEEYTIAPSLIQIEITETNMVGEDTAVADQLAKIQSLGIKLLVDDFGVGYSSLSQLRRLDLDVLKVDQSFTSDLCNGSDGDVFFSAIVSMAHALNMSVVAEGVETLQQLRVLQSLGCDEVQGYLIARPLPPEAVPAVLQAQQLMPMDPVVAMPLRLNA